MGVGRPRDPRKRQQWERWLGLWRTSGLTVRAFCRQHGLSEPSFYAWRRTLQPRHRTTAAFVPVRVLVDAAPGNGRIVNDPSASLEIVLTGNRVVRVGPGFDAASLRRLLAVLEEKSC